MFNLQKMQTISANNNNMLSFAPEMQMVTNQAQQLITDRGEDKSK